MSIWGPLGVAIGIVGLIAQANAPRCPTCDTKLVVLNNYCINCKVSWRNLN